MADRDIAYKRTNRDFYRNPVEFGLLGLFRLHRISLLLFLPLRRITPSCSHVTSESNKGSCDRDLGATIKDGNIGLSPPASTTRARGPGRAGRVTVHLADRRDRSRTLGKLLKCIHNGFLYPNQFCRHVHPLY
jgi:hypothetical protein